MSFLFGQRKRSESPSNAAEQNFNLGVQYWKQHRESEAIRELTTALDINPTFSQADQAHFILGILGEVAKRKHP